MTELTTSTGYSRCVSGLSDRYLEIVRVPKGDVPGRGKYFKAGGTRSVFTFRERESGGFDGTQRNGRPFILEPIVREHKTIGFVWTMPDEYPCFKAQFGVSETARALLAKCRLGAWRRFSKMKSAPAGELF